jgi:glycolate oxidase iron-sulfur subunit
MAGGLTENLEQAQEYISDCVHCGFCLDACPTYSLWATEADSPRGRIVLINQAVEAGGAISAEAGAHIDSCLGCLGCVTACPSGVRYDKLLQLARPEVEARLPRGPADRALRRLIFETLTHPARLRRLVPLLSAARRSGADRLAPGRLSAMAQVAPKPPAPAERRQPIPERTAPTGPPRGRVGLLLGCVQRVFFPEVHRATIGALAAEGYEVLAPAAPDCCGALQLHSGEQAAAIRRAEATIKAFGALGPLDHVITNSAGCGSAMKEYGDLLGTPAAQEFSARVKDVCEVLGTAGLQAPRGPLNLKVAYHDACHLRHAQGVREPPREMLRSIPGLELVDLPGADDMCCGSAGIYNLVAPEPAAELGRRKAELVVGTGADLLAVANPGCAAQIAHHLELLERPMSILHPVELVWRSIQAAR